MCNCGEAILEEVGRAEQLVVCGLGKTALQIGCPGHLAEDAYFALLDPILLMGGSGGGLGHNMVVDAPGVHGGGRLLAGFIVPQGAHDASARGHVLVKTLERFRFVRP